MDDAASIAPVATQSGPDPIAAYRAYLEQNTGDRAGSGVSLPSAPPNAQGSAPNIAPVAPPAAAQAAPQAQPSGPPPSDTPTLDEYMPNPIAPVNGPGQTPQADEVEQTPKAKKAKRADGAKNAPQAAQADQIAPVRSRYNVGMRAVPNAAPADPNAPSPPPAAGGVTEGGISSDPSQVMPASGHTVDEKTPDGRPKIGVAPPDHDPASSYDLDKLKDAHNADDIIDAMKPAARTKYMDWWEQQHGDINDRYDQMIRELGQRPDPNRDPTRKEKFAELMNFGLALMQNARKGADPVAAAGQSMQEALQTQKNNQQNQTAQYDQRVANIQAQRQAQLKDLGNYGEAVREDALIQNANTRTEIAQANANKPQKPAAAETRIDKDGTQWERDPNAVDPKTGNKGVWRMSVDGNGKPLPKLPPQGPRGGLSKQGTDNWSQVQKMVAAGANMNDAISTVYHTAKSTDPRTTYARVQQAALGRYATPEDADAEAEHVTSQTFGPNWRDKPPASSHPLVAPKAPAQPPPPGKIGIDQDGNRWRNVNGQAVLVPRQ